MNSEVYATQPSPKTWRSLFPFALITTLFVCISACAFVLFGYKLTSAFKLRPRLQIAMDALQLPESQYLGISTQYSAWNNPYVYDTAVYLVPRTIDTTEIDSKLTAIGFITNTSDLYVQESVFGSLQQQGVLTYTRSERSVDTSPDPFRYGAQLTYPDKDTRGLQDTLVVHIVDMRRYDVAFLINGTINLDDYFVLYIQTKTPAPFR
jgi:hypothetical protein